ncbi:DsbA family oxidoreductase [Patulibacter minatonensis]|uniref:DsbA family oxidoreductase n=1 Tax=Patulibacter minatonensis TaxID=298163 RepID=UPI00047EF9BB|nr:DsbA family protein [Patulibacter minatonensis]
MSSGTPTPQSAVVFSDPNCPFCWATEERLHALGLAGHVRWLGVQHAPELPVPMVATGRPGGEDLAGEVASIRSLAPELPIVVPPGKPNTALAIRWGAAALEADPVAGRAFVFDVYRALWTAGADLSDPAILADLAARHGFGELTPDAQAATTDGWWRAWQRTGRPGVPQLIRRDGQIVYGLAEESVLRAFLGAG